MRRTAILLGGIALLALLLTPAAGTATQQQPGNSPALFARGRELYQQACASCHGPDPAGQSAYATVPSLKDVGGAAAVDWALRTGRMPWKDTVGPVIEAGPAPLRRRGHPRPHRLHRPGGRRRRSEERRVGKECERLCRSRWSPYH